jgi:hypothetical protein
MNLNISLIKKIESILDLSGKFDKICSAILSGNVELNKSNIQNIRELTSLYMLTRAEHGAIIVLNDRLKNDMPTKDTSLSDKLINKLYDLSTFTSITENITNLVSNMDFEFKKIALMYPKLISNYQNHLILFVSKIDKEDKYIIMFEELKKLKPENEYHVIECDTKDMKVDCEKMIGMKLSISVKKRPSLYLINGQNIVDLPLENIKNINDLVKLLD